MTFDLDWALAQLDASGYGTGASVGPTEQRVRTSTQRLLEVWASMNFAENQESDTVLTLFSTLAHGHSIAPNDPEYTWFSSRTVRPKIGEVVRVSPDAFGITHPLQTLNGEQGTVLRIARGFYVVKLDNGRLEHFRPETLQTRRTRTATA